MFTYIVKTDLIYDFESLEVSLKELYTTAYGAMKMFGYNFSMEITIKENPCEGNPNIAVKISNDHDYYECPKSHITFVWQMAVQTEKSFINEIKAAIFDEIADKIEIKGE